MAYDKVFDDDEAKEELENLAILNAARMALVRRGLPESLAQEGPDGEMPIFKGAIDWAYRGVHAAAESAGFTADDFDYLEPFSKAVLIGDDGPASARVGVSSDCLRLKEFALKLGAMSDHISSALHAALSETESDLDAILNNRE